MAALAMLHPHRTDFFLKKYCVYGLAPGRGGGEKQTQSEKDRAAHAIASKGLEFSIPERGRASELIMT